MFPVLRWVLRKTEGHHLALFVAACVYQLALTAAIQHHPVHSGPLVGWLNAAGLGSWLESYVLYVVVGALADWHFDRVRDFTARHASAASIGLAVGVGLAAGIGMYFAEIARGASPGAASAVFQPVVVVEALAFGWALLAGGFSPAACCGRNGERRTGSSSPRGRRARSGSISRIRWCCRACSQRRPLPVCSPWSGSRRPGWRCWRCWA